MRKGILRKGILVLLNVFILSIEGFPDSNSEKYGDILIKNFGQINENYYRGGQPKTKDFPALKELGIRTVIDFRRNSRKQEQSWVKNAGMKYFNIPLSTTRPATEEQAAEFLKLVNDPDNWPVFVHCAAGRHRTGAMTAVYRITRDSWTADVAYKEMKRYGYYSFPNHGSLKVFVYRYFRNLSGGRETADPAPPAFTRKPSCATTGVD